jgi:hypothetical protein
MTRTSLFFGGSLAVFAARASSMSLSVVPLANAIRLPSGDQTAAPAPRGRSVRRRGSPPAIESRWIWGRAFSSAARVKATVRPSGDQRGAASRGPVVRRRGWEAPDAGTTHRLVS